MKGFISLALVIFLLAFAAVLLLSASLSLRSSAFQTVFSEASQKNRSIIEGCAEIALSRLKGDYDGYGGDETIAISLAPLSEIEATCTVFAVERDGARRILKLAAINYDNAKRVKIIVKNPSMNLEEYRFVDTF